MLANINTQVLYKTVAVFVHSQWGRRSSLRPSPAPDHPALSPAPYPRQVDRWLRVLSTQRLHSLVRFDHDRPHRATDRRGGVDEGAVDVEPDRRVPLDAEAVRRAWFPLLLVSRRTRSVLLVAALPCAWEALRHRRGPGWFALRVLDDLAYGCGVWAGCARERSAAALLPQFTGRTTR